MSELIKKFGALSNEERSSAKIADLVYENASLKAERDAALSVVERVRAIVDFWNDTPDYQPSEYDKGRVDQRHAMTEQLIVALEPKEKD